ncbi:MAG: hypothetical protein R2991_08495 [Thermoanaerobaculia bacterium]
MLSHAHHRTVIARLLFVLCLLGSAAGSESPSPGEASETARGTYLARHVVRCQACHARRDWTAFSGPVAPGTEAEGGTVDLFGSTAAAPPLTPEALFDRSVEWIAAAILGREPADAPAHRDRTASGLSELLPADARAIAVAVKGDPPAGDPRPSIAASEPWRGRPVDAGRYLVTVGRCRLCHGEDLGGGLEVEIPIGRSHPSANLTADPAGTTGRLDRDEFIAYFRSLDDPALAAVPVPEGELNTAMPWPWLAGLNEDDLGAIYDYLRSLPPVGTADAEPLP